MPRQTKQESYFKTCEAWDGRVACTRRHCVAVLVKNDVVISIGYNGSVRGSMNCGEECECIKDLYNEERLTSYLHCPAIHGEVNAVLNAAREGKSTVGATLYFRSNVTTDNGRPCNGCRRVLIQAGIKDCYFMNGKGEITYETTNEWIMMENNWMIDQIRNKPLTINSECQNGPDGSKQ